MGQESFKQKPTAILSADVVGCSGLMSEDEDATIRTQTTYRELMSMFVQCVENSQRTLFRPYDLLETFIQRGGQNRIE